MKAEFIYFLIKYKLFTFKDLQLLIIEKFIDSEEINLFKKFLSLPESEVKKQDILDIIKVNDEQITADFKTNWNYKTKVLATLLLSNKSLTCEKKVDILINFYDEFRVDMHWDKDDFDYSFLLQLESEKEARLVGNSVFFNHCDEVNAYIKRNSVFNNENIFINLLFTTR